MLVWWATEVECASAIARRLEAQGLRKVIVSFADSKVRFAKQADSDLRQAISGIEELGYRVTPISTTDAAAPRGRPGLSSVEKKFCLALLFTAPLLAHMLTPLAVE